MAYTISSNRGMTGFPAEYVQGWQNYNPVPQGGGLTGKAARNANAAENMAYSQGGGSGGLAGLLSPYTLNTAGSAVGGTGAYMGPSPLRAGRGAVNGRWNPNWQPGQYGAMQYSAGSGGSGGGSGGGGGTPTTSPTPGTPAPAPTPSPTQQMGTDLQALLAGYTNPITNGLLDNATIQQAMATLNAGSPSWATQQFGGAFGQNLGQELGRAGINLQRGAAEQQSSMDLAHQRAKAGAGLDMAGLLAQLNQQNVMHDLNMRSGGLGAITGLLGGLL